MLFEKQGQRLLCREGTEQICLEPWGKNSLRMRATRQAAFIEQCWALTEEPASCPDVAIHITEEGATLCNGKIKVFVKKTGKISYFKEDQLILEEYTRCWSNPSPQGAAAVIEAREYKPIIGGDFAVTQRFEARPDEKIYGMGQYQQPNLNLKGCVLELAQRNTQISVPFAVSNLGYGFLWNNPAVGEAVFGTNMTQWKVRSTKQLEYWITAGDSPREIVSNYADATGHAPEMPEDVMGFWQCKLRYRTQEELLSVAREYKRRNIPLDVIIIDFFHWIYQGDWSFDPKYWPDPQAMVDELNELGVRLMVSVWPTVDSKSVNFPAMQEQGLLISAEHGLPISMSFQGSTLFTDATNPKAQEFLWDQVKENYGKYGIDLFWLDVAEPEYTNYDFDNYRYHLGPNNQVGNIYPSMYAKAFYDGLRAEGKSVVTLSRCAWAGTQKYGAVAWSGDIPSTYEAFRNQIVNGVNMGLAGIPWWNTDIGGFIGGNIEDPAFTELLIRWFQFGTYSPVMRLHGNRLPGAKPVAGEGTGSGAFPSGSDNEVWSYGDDALAIFTRYINVRYDMHDYIKALMDEAHATGAPVMRAMFYEFPEDNACWDLNDQYMFGADYLVAPVMAAGVTQRSVYLPAGQWRNVDTNEVLQGGRTVTAPAPLEIIPVFQRVQ
ncbi:MAG: glycoside hydrolase family 31 protein [Eubacteriales bacterium]|nr:glycoside hydrolase family 31 protein [Eubacteriales bacterium]